MCFRCTHFDYTPASPLRDAQNKYDSLAKMTVFYFVKTSIGVGLPGSIALNLIKRLVEGFSV
jgi:hypothetical protein